MEKELESEVKGPVTRTRSAALNTPDRVLRSRGDKFGTSGITPPHEVSPKHTLKRSSIEPGTCTPSKRVVRASSAQPEGQSSTKKIATRRRSSSVQPESPKKEESNPSITRRKRTSITPDVNLNSPTTRSLRSVAKSDSSFDPSKTPQLPAIQETKKLTRRSSCSPSKEILTKTLVTTRRKSLLPNSESSPKTSDSSSHQTPPNLSRKKIVKGVELSPVEEKNDESALASSNTSRLKAKIPELAKTPTAQSLVNRKYSTGSSKKEFNKESINISQKKVVLSMDLDSEKGKSSKHASNEGSSTTNDESATVTSLASADLIRESTELSVDIPIKSGLTSPNSSMLTDKNESCSESEDSGIKEMEEFVFTENSSIKSDNEVPKTFDNEVPKTSDDEDPKISDNEDPKISDIEVLKTSDDKVPKASDNEVLKTSDNEVSKKFDNEVPKTSYNEVPKTSDNEVPKTFDIEVPKTADNEVPKTSDNEVPKTSDNEVPKISVNDIPKTADNGSAVHEQKDDTNSEGIAQRSEKVESGITSKLVNLDQLKDKCPFKLSKGNTLFTKLINPTVCLTRLPSDLQYSFDVKQENQSSQFIMGVDNNKSSAEVTNPDVITNSEESQISVSKLNAPSSPYTLAESNKALMCKGLLSKEMSKKPLSPVSLNDSVNPFSGKENKKPLLLNVADKSEPAYAEASATTSLNHAEVIENVQKLELIKPSQPPQEITEGDNEAQIPAIGNCDSDNDDLEFKLRLSENESHGSNEYCIVSSNQSSESNDETVFKSNEEIISEFDIEETKIHEQANKTSHLAVEKKISIERDSSEEISPVKSLNETNLVGIVELSETVDHANNTIEEDGEVALTINVKNQDTTALSDDDSRIQSNDDSELNLSETNTTDTTITTGDGKTLNEIPTKFDKEATLLGDTEKYSSPKKVSITEDAKMIINDLEEFTGIDKVREAETLTETAQSSEIKTKITDDLAQSNENKTKISDELASNVDNDPLEKSDMSSYNETRVSDDETKVCDSETITSDEINYETTEEQSFCSNEGTNTPNKETSTSVGKTMENDNSSKEDTTSDGNTATVEGNTPTAAKSKTLLLKDIRTIEQEITSNDNIESSGTAIEAKIKVQEESGLSNKGLKKLNGEENEVACIEGNSNSDKEPSVKNLNNILDKEDCINLMSSECANQIKGDLSSGMDENNGIKELDESATEGSQSIILEDKLKCLPRCEMDKSVNMDMKVSVSTSDMEVFITDEKVKDKPQSPCKSYESSKTNRSINKSYDEMNDTSNTSHIELISSSDEETDASLNTPTNINESNVEKEDQIIEILDDQIDSDESTCSNTEKSVFIDPLHEKNDVGHSETPKMIFEKIPVTTKNNTSTDCVSEAISFAGSPKVSLDDQSEGPPSPKINNLTSEDSSPESTDEEPTKHKQTNELTSVLQDICIGYSESQSTDSEKSSSSNEEPITGRDFLDIETEEGEETSSEESSTSNVIDIPAVPSYFEPKVLSENPRKRKVINNLGELKGDLKKTRSEKINECVKKPDTNPPSQNLNKLSSSSESSINKKIGELTIIKRKENVNKIELKKSLNKNPKVGCGVQFDVNQKFCNLDKKKIELPSSRNFKVASFTRKSYQDFISRCGTKNDKSLINCNVNRFFVLPSDNALPKQTVKRMVSHNSVFTDSRSQKKDLKHLTAGDLDKKMSCGVESFSVSPLRLDTLGSTTAEPSSKRKHEAINDKNDELKSKQGFESSSPSSPASNRSKKKSRKADSSQESIISACSNLSPSASRERLNWTNEGKESKPVAVIHNLGIRDNAHLLQKILFNNGIKKIERIEFSWEPQMLENFQGRGTIEFANETELQKAVNLSYDLEMNGKRLWMKPSALYKPSSKDFETWLSSYTSMYKKRQIKEGKAC